ncbi:MAG: hypothetical protein RIA71_04350 [Oceanicaulis sp.]
MQRNVNDRVLFAGALAMLLGLSACGQGNQPSQNVVTEEEELITAYSWESIAPAMFAPGPPATLQLSGSGFAYLVFADSFVSAGETLSATFTIQGEAERLALIMMSRHCDAQNGEDHAREYVTLSGASQTGEIAHTFSASYSCVRLSFHSPDADPLVLTVSDLSITTDAPPQ